MTFIRVRRWLIFTDLETIEFELIELTNNKTKRKII